MNQARGARWGGWPTLALLFGSLLMAGCATVAERDPRDPLEPFNRAVYRFNMDFDQAFLKPTARAYRAVAPPAVDRGVTNFFNNIADIKSVANNILQFKMARAGSDVGRLFINTTVGVLGVFDVATNVGLESYKEDFGQTLGYWGFSAGPYLMLPLLGPSSLRDTVGFAGDLAADPLVSLKQEKIYWGFVGLRIVDQRAARLGAEQLLEETLDPYGFMRDVYLQRRQTLVYDGNPPVDESAADFWDEVDF